MARILVVDDSPVVRRMLGVILERDGHQVTYAVDGEEALAAVAAQHPELVFTDLEMPKMDGPTFVRHARTVPAGSTTPFVLMTASAETEHHEAVRQLGVDAFVTKPLRSTEVLGIVGRLLGPGASPR